MGKCAIKRYRKKPGVFIGLPLIHDQHWKSSAHYFWDFYQEKLATKFNKMSWWALWVGDPRNFHNSFFVKNYLNLILFSSSQKRYKPSEDCLT